MSRSTNWYIELTFKREALQGISTSEYKPLYEYFTGNVLAQHSKAAANKAEKQFAKELSDKGITGYKPFFVDRIEKRPKY